MGKGWISLNTQGEKIQRWIKWAADPEAFPIGDSYAIVWEIVEDIVHENVHAYEGSSHEDTHNDAFYQKMVDMMLDQVLLGVVPEEIAGVIQTGPTGPESTLRAGFLFGWLLNLLKK